jgi:hypothetical protein
MREQQQHLLATIRMKAKELLADRTTRPLGSIYDACYGKW